MRSRGTKMTFKCYKTKPGTEYAAAVKEHFDIKPKWKNMFSVVSDLLGEKIERIAFVADELVIEPSDIKNEQKRKLFTKDGYLKKNMKKSREILDQYKQAIKDNGLEGYKDLGRINFSYGIYRAAGQEFRSFGTSEGELYFKADYDLNSRADGLLEEISEIEYEEKYLYEIKKREKNNQ